LQYLRIIKNCVTLCYERLKNYVVGDVRKQTPKKHLLLISEEDTFIMKKVARITTITSPFQEMPTETSLSDEVLLLHLKSKSLEVRFRHTIGIGDSLSNSSFDLGLSGSNHQ